MAKKLAPLVIPAVIDTSGIDKGVNSIRSKLSRVRGQGAGGGGIGGGGGGFSSGVTPFGVNIGGSGTAAAAMAAAFGAAATSRTGVNFRALKKNAATRNRQVQNTLDAIRAESRMSEGFEVTGIAQDINDIANIRTAREAVARAKAKPSFGERFQNLRGNARMFLDVKGSMDFYKKQSGKPSRGTTLSRLGLPGLGSILGAAAGGSLAYGAFKQFGTRNMQERFGDLSQFTGNAANYIAAANIKRDSYNAPPTASQGFYLGLRQGTGGRQSTIETLLKEIGNAPSAIAQQGGKFAGYLDTAARMGMGANLGTKSQQEAAGINAAMLTAEAVAAGGFGGPQVGNSIYNFMKRLFY